MSRSLCKENCLDNLNLFKETVINLLYCIQTQIMLKFHDILITLCK